MKTRNKRISLLVALSLFLALGPFSFKASFAQKTEPAVASMKLRFSGIHPAMALPSRAWQFWMDKVKEKTNGRITFEPYWGATLVSMGELIDGTAKGLSDVTSGLWIFDPGKVPLGAFDTNFLFNNPDVTTSVKIKRQMFAEIPALNEELAKWNLAPAIYFAPVSPYNLLTKKPVKRLADLKGMRIGHTPVEMVPAFKVVGAASVVSPAPEFYNRLERGLIDGICLPQNIMGIYKLRELAKHYTIINLNTPVVFTLYINADTWKKLSPQDQQIWKDAGREAEQFYLVGLKKELADLEKIYKKAGVQFYTMPKSDIKQWVESIPDIPAEWAKKMEASGAPGWQIVDKYLELSKKEGWEFPRKFGVR
jgi:TRAP-type C4-dicarboxylate transport system substrate-binding protein